MTPEDIAYWSRGDVWAVYLSTWSGLIVLAVWFFYKLNR